MVFFLKTFKIIKDFNFHVGSFIYFVSNGVIVPSSSSTLTSVYPLSFKYLTSLALYGQSLWLKSLSGSFIYSSGTAINFINFSKFRKVSSSLALIYIDFIFLTSTCKAVISSSL